jgi:phosphohistidine phosphatase SixA
MITPARSVVASEPRRHSRRAAVILGLVLTVLAASAPQARAQEAIFLVRHAERLDTTDDSPLSDAGRLRAQHLRDMLRDAGITAIYVTQFQRTADTAKPLADALGLPLQRIPAADTKTLLSKLRSAGPKARVLVVSHSDRMPGLMKNLGYAPDLTIGPAEYDNLFIVMPHGRNEPTVLRLRF